MRPGQEPTPLAQNADQATPKSGDGAVVTALSSLEDAALVMFAPQREVDVTRFARYMKRFIPLKDVTFLPADKLYSKDVKGLPGFFGEGTGRLPSNDTPVHFQCLAIDVEGQPVFVILYAEESQKTRYQPVFERIMNSLEPTFKPRAQIQIPPDKDKKQGANAPAEAPQAPPGAEAAPPPVNGPDAGTAPPEGQPAPETQGGDATAAPPVLKTATPPTTPQATPGAQDPPGPDAATTTPETPTKAPPSPDTPSPVDGPSGGKAPPPNVPVTPPATPAAVP